MRMTLALLSAMALALPLQAEGAREGESPSRESKDICVQLYSVRSIISNRFEEVLGDLARMGFTSVEAANYSDGKFYGRDPSAFRAAVETTGMKVLSSHVSHGLDEKNFSSGDFSDKLAWWDDCIAAHKAAGMQYIVTPWMGLQKSLADLQLYCDYLNAVGRKCRDAGIRYGYHNHAYEFEKVEGQVMYDYLLEHTDPECVFFQMDVYWAVIGKASPVEYFKKYPGRFRMLHIKDEKEIGQSGMVGFDAIFRNVQTAGVEAIVVEVERYSYDDVERSVSESIDYLLEAPFVKSHYIPRTHSFLQILDTRTGDCTLVKEFPYRIEAPNWTVDGKWLIYNSGGKIYRIPIGGGDSEVIDTGDVQGCNNDHVLSADGKSLAVSGSTADRRGSRVYVLPIGGGTPRLVTENAPSYLHGWSPDGKTLCYCAARDGEYDVYTIPAGGGEERRLTDAPGLDDGPEFSPDGKYIWFNSVRTGLMQIWKMKADGSGQTQVTFDEDLNSWFPHVSPNGKSVAFIAYHKGDLEPGQHLPDKNVVLRVIDNRGRRIRTVHSLFGGQGTINVNSWSPDSRHLAFVSYSHD